jgi:hypothetical protein
MHRARITDAKQPLLQAVLDLNQVIPEGSFWK